MRNFNKIFGVVLVFLFGLFLSSSSAVGIENKDNQKSVLVLSDRVEQANAKYFIYPQVSEMVASEIINKLNTDGDVVAPSLSDVRAELRTPELIRASYSLLDNYRYTYDINYSALRKIAKHFDTTNVLLVTGALDTTSDFLKPTWWAFLNVPGENVVKSEFKLYTYVALVDLTNETVSWQNVYERKLVAPEFGLTNLNYSPDAKQMVKVKKGSQLIAKDVAYRVESVLTPLIAAKKTPPTVHEFMKMQINKKYKESIQNINELKKKTVNKINEIKEQKKSESVQSAEIQAESIKFERIETPAVNVETSKEKSTTETNAILNFVKIKNDKKAEEEKLDNKVLEVINEKAIQTESSNSPVDMDLRPAIETDENIKINPINIIIPKM